MKTTITQTEGLARQIDVVVPADVVSERIAKRLEAVASTVKLDGFRPGKVPMAVVKQRLGEQVGQDVAGGLIDEFLPKAIAEHKIEVAGQPHVHAGHGHDGHAVAAAEGEDFHFHAHVEVMPEFEPKGYDKLKITKPVAEVTDAMVDEALKRLEGQMATYEKKDGSVATGDRVTMTGQGYKKGGKGKEDEAFEGGNLKDFKVVIGSGSLIPGFEEGLIDAKAGDQVDVEVTFPKEYHAPELAGAPAVFKLTIDMVEAQKDEPLTDDSAKQFGFENLEGLKDVLRKGAARDLTQATDQRVKRQLLDALDNANKFDLPQGMVAAEHQALWRAQLQELQQRGLPIEALGKSVEEVQDELKVLAERRVKLGLVLAAISKKQNLKVEAKDLDAAVEAQIAAAGPQADQARQYFANPRMRQQLAGPILEDKVTAWLLSQAEVKEEKIEAKDLLTELE